MVPYGQALIQSGKSAEGIPSLKAGLTVWDTAGGKVRSPTTNMFLAEGTALTGDLDDALRLIDEQIVQIERPGWEERMSYAEILRLEGWMLLLKGDLGDAERNFLASLDWARRQRAKMWELRTSTSLARLWQSQGKRVLPNARSGKRTSKVKANRGAAVLTDNPSRTSTEI